MHRPASGVPPFCPVFIAATVCSIARAIGPEAPICQIDSATQVTPDHISAVLRAAARRDGLALRGFPIDCITPHSNRASAAVQMYLAGFDEETIKRLGRWSSNAWMIYIRPEIAQLNTGVSAALAVDYQLTHL